MPQSETWSVSRFGEPSDVLTLVDAAPSPLGTEDVRVGTRANGLNALDVGMCRGSHPMRPTTPFVLGAELVGDILEVGESVTRLQPGDRVIAMSPLAYGNFRRDVVVPEYAAHVIPDAIPDTDAAALLVNYQAAYTALVRRARVQPGEWVLITAAAGALGTALVQIAHTRGARVIAAAGTDEKRSACLSLGAEIVLDSRDPALAAHVRDATGGPGVDVACDLIGGGGFAIAAEAAAFEARLLTMGWTSGSMPTIEPMSLIAHNLTVIGMSWGAAYPREAPEVVRETHAQILELYANGKIRPLIGQIVPHADLPNALAAIGAATTVGKSVMTW